MRRVFWVAMGAAAGSLVVRKVSRTARSLTPAGLADSITHSVADIAGAIREFGSEVKVAMAEREEELMAALADDGTELGALPHNGQR